MNRISYDRASSEVVALRKERDRLVRAARPFGEMAQEMLTGHLIGHLPAGAPEELLGALAAAAENEGEQ